MTFNSTSEMKIGIILLLKIFQVGFKYVLAIQGKVIVRIFP